MSVVIVEKLENSNFLQVDARQILQDDVVTRRMRMAITRARKHLGVIPARCGLCKEPIYIRRNPFGQEGYHFSHFRTEDDSLKRCPQRTENHADIALMRGLKYQGALESKKHFDLKHLIANLLKNDDQVKPGSVKVESTLSCGGEWRRPDVQAVMNELLIAFEVQVSTEMADMIVAREHFYERFGSIIWVLPEFSPDKMNQSQRDILTTNSEHLFVLNDEMKTQSLSENQLKLEVWVNWPVLTNKEISWDWQRHTASLRDIQFENGHPFLLDVLGEEKKLRLKVEAIEKQEAELELLERNKQIAHDKRKNDQAILERNKKIAREYRENKGYRAQISVNKFEAWLSRFDHICEELIHPVNKNKMRDRLAQSGASWSQNPTSTAEGLWLMLHGISIRECDCSSFVIKSLLCASKGRLDYGYTSWLYIARGLIRDHLTWFPPFYKVLRHRIPGSEFLKVQTDPNIQKTISTLKNSPVLLTKMQHKLLNVFSPFGTTDHAPLNVLRSSAGRAVFPFRRLEDMGLGGGGITPPDLNVVYEETHSGDIVDVLGYLVEENKFIPFPNLPVPEEYDRYYIDAKDCEIVLPSWRSQLQKIESELFSF